MNKRVLLILCLVVAVDSASFGLLLPVVPFFVNQLTGSFNAIAVTSVTAIYSGLQFLGAPVIGRLSDRWGRRGILTIAVGISALALIGQGLSTSLTMLLLFSALNGASSGVFAISQAMVADAVEDRDQRTVGFGAIGAALGLGFIIGPGLGGALGALNPRYPFVVAAAFCIINVILIRLYLPESRQQKSQSDLDQQRQPNPLLTAGSGRLRKLISIYFLFYLGFSAFSGIFVLAAKDRFNWGPQPTSLVLVYVGVVAVIVQGALLPKLLKRLRPDRLSMIGLTLVAVAMFGVSVIKQGSSLYITQLLFAGGVGLSTPGLRSAMSLCVSEDQQGVLGGLTQSVVSLTSLIGPLLAGQMFERAGYSATFQVQAYLVIGAIALLISMPRIPAQANAQEVKTPSA